MEWTVHLCQCRHESGDYTSPFLSQKTHTSLSSPLAAGENQTCTPHLSLLSPSVLLPRKGHFHYCHYRCTYSAVWNPRCQKVRPFLQQASFVRSLERVTRTKDGCCRLWVWQFPLKSLQGTSKISYRSHSKDIQQLSQMEMTAKHVFLNKSC